MTHLQKLSIKGVRSFDPDTQQEITFFPLTLIHGPNGSGKTTIIEALKYATTGTLPANCNSGRSFVHDVQFADKATIKGKVRLQYTDVHRRPTVVSRRMQTSFRQPRNGQPVVTFTQLNSVIKRLDDGGGRHPWKSPATPAPSADGQEALEKQSSPLQSPSPSSTPNTPTHSTTNATNSSTTLNHDIHSTGDINSEVLASIGVNKAILNSVIFCHQEDTNWPLAEGKVLKERLNGIFGSDGYLERLEQIKRARENESKTFHLLEKDVRFFAMVKKEVASKRKELNEEQARNDTEKRKVQELEVDAKTLQERLDNLTVKEARVESASNAILEIRRSLEDMGSMARGIEATCNSAILAKSNEQVNEELEHFDENAMQLLARKRELETKLEKLESEQTRLVYDKQRLGLERAKANEYATQIYKLFAERNALISTIKCNSPEFHSIIAKCAQANNNNNNNHHNHNNCPSPGPGAPKLNPAERAYVIAQFDTQLDQLTALANEKRSSMQIQEYKLMQELDSLKNLKSNASHEKAIWQIQLQKAEREQAQLERTMSTQAASMSMSMSTSSASVYYETQIKTLAEKADSYRAQLVAQYDAASEDKLTAAIGRLEAQAADYRNGIENTRRRLEEALSAAREKEEFEYYRRLRAEKAARLEVIRHQKLAHVFAQSSSNANSQIAFLNNSSSDLSDIFYELLEKASCDQEQYATRVAHYENELCSRRCKLESQTELLSRRIKELDSNKSKFDGICSIHTFEAFLKGKEIELHQLRDERAKQSGRTPVIESHVETIRHSDHCPVCEKEISASSGGWTSKKTAQMVDKQSLIEGLRKSTAEGQQEVKRLEVQIQASERLCAKLGKLRSSYEAIQHVTREILLIKGELPSLRNEVSVYQKTVEEERNHLRACRARVEALRRCTRDVVEYDSSLRELADIDRKLANFDTSKWSSDLVDGINSITGEQQISSPPSAETLNQHLSIMQHNLDQTSINLAELQKESVRFSREKMLLQTLLQAVERSKAELEVQDQMAGLKRRNEIVAEMNEAKGKIVALEGRAAAEFDPQIDRLEGQLRALAGELASAEKDNHHAVFAIQDASKKLKHIFSEIDRFSFELAQSQKITCPEQVEKLQKEMEQFEETKRMFSQQLNEATQAIGNLELQKRELFDCKRYINLQKNIREGEDRLREEEAKMGNMSLVEAKTSCTQTYNELAMLKSKIAVMHERTRANDQRLAVTSAKLERGRYASADRRYREKLLEKTVTELAIEDLNRYYRALDHSICAFHRSKMEEVNKLLVSFWQIAYQGGDIDHIGIVASPSAEEEAAAAAAAASGSSLTSTCCPPGTSSNSTSTTIDDTQSSSTTLSSPTAVSAASAAASASVVLGRRNFTYRVIMVKKGKVMNMRGRCSAGQKVLASFIIRLALAVIFCRDRFAVLTLDEPTTNLDKANIHSFSKAVISLIRSNKHQFQIIIITHDNEFLQCLNAHTGEFYEVLKDYKGYSTIIRKSTSEVHMTGFPAIKVDRRRGPRKRKGDSTEDSEDVPLKFAPKRARKAIPVQSQKMVISPLQNGTAATLATSTTPSSSSFSSSSSSVNTHVVTLLSPSSLTTDNSQF